MEYNTPQKSVEERLAALEAQYATLLEMVKTLTARPPAVPVTARDFTPQYRDRWGNWLPPGVVPDHTVVSGSGTNPWMSQKWSSGATPGMFGMREKKP